MSDHGGDLDHFDPDQSLDERREIQRGMRDLLRKTKDSRDDLMNADASLYAELLRESDGFMRKAKQTSEATIDARFVLHMAELAYQRSVKVTVGGSANGLDVDEFVSKCITYMKHGGGIADDAHAELSSTQHRRRTINNSNNSRRRAARGMDENDEEDDDDEVGDEGDALNWAHFGKYACLPFVRRPALPGLLLGPLSVERKARKVAKRTAPLKISSLHEVRPEVLDPLAMRGDANAEKGDLTATCSRIFRLLQKTVADRQEACMGAVEAELPERLHDDPASLRPFYDRFAIRSTGGIDLLRFAVNPRSFAQTVENIFYISFLIRDGKVNLEFDEDGLPSISPEDDDEQEAAGRSNSTRHQAIIELDQERWKEVVKVFKITESIIPHRQETDHSGPGARGWYNS